MTNSHRRRSSLTFATLAGAVSLAVAALAAPPLHAATTLPANGDEDALLSELINRGLTPLLDRYLEQRNIPEDQRTRVRALLDGVHALSSPKPLPAAQQQQALSAINTNLDALLSTFHDPRFFLQVSTLLIRSSIERDANTLEYWGPSSSLQLSLRPTVQTTLKLLDTAAAEAGKQRDAIADSITSRNQEAMSAKYVKLDNLATSAEFTRNMSVYYLALTYDAAAPERRDLAEKAIEYLKQFDNADSQVQPSVRLRIAKLRLVAEDFAEAAQLFASVAQKQEITPAPDLSQQFDARYFAAVTELLAGHLDLAEQQLADLRGWIGSAIPADNTAARNGASAAASILEYRILMAHADLAATDQEKQGFKDKARDLLSQLVAARPDLRSVIYGQILATLPENADLSSLDPLVLSAMVRQGDQERLKPAEEKIDKPLLERALAAARELVKRRGQGGVSNELADTAALLQGFFLDRLGQPADAAGAFLDFLEKATQAPDVTASSNLRLALDNAIAIIDQLRKTNPYDDAAQKLYERVLPIAIKPPFDRRELAYDWARQLQKAGKYSDAISFFRLVPDTDKRITSARFFLMLALKQQLDAGGDSLTAVLRGQMIADIHKLADEVTSAATASSKDPAVAADQQLAYRTLVAKTALVSADTALRHEADSRRTLKLLEGFEPLAAGLPDENSLLADALLLRVNAHMDLNQSTEATQDLVALLSHQSGGQGANIIYTLLQRLDGDLDAARKAGNRPRMVALAQSRAALSGYLVDWAAKNDNPDIRKYTYRYRVFDAGTHHLAAQLQPEAGQRTAALQAALKKYQALLSPENHKEYVATLPAGSDLASDDPAVLLGIASVDYDLGDWEHAQQLFAGLLQNKKLGPPQTSGPDGVVDNDAYWEATCKLLRCNLELAKSAADPKSVLEPSRALLTRLNIEYGPSAGGPKWSGTLAGLRQEFGSGQATTGPTTAASSH